MTRAYVITIMDLPQSVEAAERCIASGEEFGVEVETMSAVTPDDLDGMLELNPISLDGFKGNKYSRYGPCVATFLSHYSIWKWCARKAEPIVCLEHDAIFVAPLPDLSMVLGVTNLAKPSFGQFRVPRAGIGPFFSKAGGYLGGAHGYYVHPDGARRLLEKAKTEAMPTDLFICLDRFPFLTEHWPWVVECEDSFSSIQNEVGCRAHHNDVKPLEW